MILLRAKDMNELIDLLALSALDSKGALDRHKFAESIIRECATIYIKIDHGNLHLGTDDYIEALHKHFGNNK